MLNRAVTVGARIRALREARGWEQKDLAFRAGVHPSTISLIERDARQACRAETLAKIAKALNTTVGYLVGEEESPLIVRQDTKGAYSANWDDYREAVDLAIQRGISPDQLVELIRRAVH